MTRRQRRKFTPEFKHESACLILDQRYTCKQACESLDLTETALRGWVKQLQAERGDTTPTSPALTQDQRKRERVDVERLELKVQVKEMFTLSRGSLGSRRIRVLMGEVGVEIGRLKVPRLVKEMDLVSKQPGGHKYKQATVELLDIPNCLNREFAVAEPDQV